LKKRILISFLLITALLSLLSCGKKSTQSAEVGNKAPEISLSDINGNMVSLESLKGNVVILNLWSYT